MTDDAADEIERLSEVAGVPDQALRTYSRLWQFKR
jgi:hypothetical protein